MTADDMTPRKPTALVVVCAAHAVLGWALLSLGTDRMPSSARALPGGGSRWVSVHLVSATSTAVAAPVTIRARDAAQALPLPAPPVRRSAAAVVAHAASVLGYAPTESAATTTAAAGPAASADGPPTPPAGAATPEPSAAASRSQALPAPTTSRVDTRTRNEAPPTVLAQADRQQCPPAPHPAALRERGIEGAVVLRVKVDVQGRAADVRLLAGSGWRLFDEAALQQVRACRFIPATQGGQAIDSWVEFPVRFALAG